MSVYRVWPDGTAQDVDDGDPYSWMSDDYWIVTNADTEEEAIEMALGVNE